ncbi:hypothetical protein PRUPE_8G119700 [Prunus persica]|uniref:Uncharacterized protein n=1 Tax=Prunus persica TaxID=3760 RepID=A0A251MWN2_PRUPE|nr:uncharacterized protein LOC18767140 isoform X1 [Prunus persica]XP_020409446.1 uncharacterized protein LOC18767140 isoform X1 [Prunus persica]ONH91511.1 hypothetical protein PRUPE_8G119700 [Prunus persica]ONH91512.1 hypothetical protein PRUPE_8G119700 [Prunus persica]
MELELQGQPGSSGSGSSGSHVVSIHDEELPTHTRFLSPSPSVDYNAYYKLRPPEVPKDVNKDIMSSLQKQVDDYDNPKQKQEDDHNKPKHRTKFTYSEKWIFFLISLGLETISASFDQLSSPSKPHYALYGMLLAIAAVLICICELIHKGYRERVEFKRWGRIWWYYHPYPPNRLFGNFPDICGLVLAIAQSICSGVQYDYLHRHANNPIKLSILPFMFLLSLGISRCCKD